MTKDECDALVSYSEKIYSRILYLYENSDGSRKHDLGMHCSYILNYIQSFKRIINGEQVKKYECLKFIGYYTIDELASKLNERTNSAINYLKMRGLK